MQPLAAHLQRRLQQHGCGDGLDQKTIEHVLLFQGTLLQGLAAVARDHHHHRLGGAAAGIHLAQALGRLACG